MFRHETMFPSGKFVRYSSFLYGRVCKQNLWFTSLPIWAFVYLPMIRTLCLGLCRVREDSLCRSLTYPIYLCHWSHCSKRRYLSHGLPLNRTYITLSWVFPTLHKDFLVLKLISITLLTQTILLHVSAYATHLFRTLWPVPSTDIFINLA